MHDRPISAKSAFHSLVWPIWLAAAGVAISWNPLLNVLLIAQAVLVAITCHTESPVGRAFGLFVRWGAALVVVRTLLAGVPVGGISYGSTVLFVLPELQLPIWLGGLHVGGTVTLEMVAGGFVAGIRLWTLILVFGAFNAVTDHYGLLRRTPRMLFHVGLATTIALTFVPQVILQLGAIRDAQRVRGHRFRSWRDGLPLLVPLLAGGLERSIQLAEAMDSRGYGGTAPRRGTRAIEIGLIFGVTLLAMGLYFGLTGDWRGWLAAALGGGLAIALLHRLGAGPPRSRYVRETWRGRDTLVALASVVLLLAMITLHWLRLGGLLYTTQPRISLPPFEPATGVLLLLLSVPALIQLVGIEGAYERQHRVQHPPVADRG